jgi:phosphatidyl-myo-inositol dimannoside synthase
MIKKICYFGSDYPPTGGGIATYDVEWLHSVSQSVDVSELQTYIFGNKQPRVETVNDKLRVVVRKTKNFFKIGIEILYFMFINRDATVFHAFYLFPIGFWMVVWSKFFGIPTMVTIYGTDTCSKEGSKITRSLKRFTLIHATKVISISEFTKEATIKALSLPAGMTPIEVIYISVPKLETNKSEDDIVKAVYDFKEKFSFDDSSFVILTVGRLVKRKGFNYLIQSVSHLNSKNIKLLIVGDGPEKEKLKQEIIDHKLDDRVFLLGKVDDLVPLYRFSKVFVLPSFGMVKEGDFEGLGLVFLEAQSFGLPVIGTNSGGIPETFNHGITGILVPEKDPVALAAAIEKLYTDVELRQRMSSATKSFLKERFGKEKMIDQYLSLINSIR